MGQTDFQGASSRDAGDRRPHQCGRDESLAGDCHGVQSLLSDGTAMSGHGGMASTRHISVLSSQVDMHLI